MIPSLKTFAIAGVSSLQNRPDACATIMDQAIAGAGNRLSGEQVRGLLGTFSPAVLEELLGTVARSATDEALRLLDELMSEGHNPAHLARQLVRLRDLCRASGAYYNSMTWRTHGSAAAPPWATLSARLNGALDVGRPQEGNKGKEMPRLTPEIRPPCFQVASSTILPYRNRWPAAVFFPYLAILSLSLPGGASPSGLTRS